MSTNQYISVRETAQILAVSEKTIMTMIESRKLQAYRIADKFLRLKKDEVLNLRNSGQVDIEESSYPYSPAEKVKDFFYFNDFYIALVCLIVFLLYIIFYT